MADREDTRALIQHVQVVAKLCPKETHYKAPGDHVMTVLPGRPHFLISEAMTLAGYAPGGADWQKWNTIKVWMYGPDTELLSGPGPRWAK